MKLFAILLLQFAISTFALAEIFLPDLNEKSTDSLEMEEIIIFNHNTKWWDHQSISLPGTRSLLEFSKVQKITSLGVIHEPATQNEVFAKQYFFVPGETDLTLFSSAGGHQLSFPRLNKVFFSGGYLDQCLCSAIRSVVLGRALKPGESLVIVLVGNAIYKNIEETDDLETLQNIDVVSLKEIVEKYYVSKNPWNCLGNIDVNTIVNVYLKDKLVLVYENESHKVSENKVFNLHVKNTDFLN